MSVWFLLSKMKTINEISLNLIPDILNLSAIIGDLLVCLINQKHEVFYLGKVCFLVFYTGMILSRHL